MTLCCLPYRFDRLIAPDGDDRDSGLGSQQEVPDALARREGFRLDEERLGIDPFEEVIKYAKSHKKVWFARRGDIERIAATVKALAIAVSGVMKPASSMRSSAIR